MALQLWPVASLALVEMTLALLPALPLQPAEPVTVSRPILASPVWAWSLLEFWVCFWYDSLSVGRVLGMAVCVSSISVLTGLYFPSGRPPQPG